MRSTASLMSSMSRRLTGSVNSISRMARDTRTRARMAFQRARRYFFLSFFSVASSFSCAFSYRARALRTASICLCTSRARSSRRSSVISSSLKITSSRIVRWPALRASPIAMIFWDTVGVRVMDLMTASLPRSMRLAISTSPSRVSSGTVPISRRYIRTGSLVLSSVPGVRSSSSSSPSCFSSRNFWSESTTSMPALPKVLNRSSSSSDDVMSARRRSLTSS